jgi:ribA/ribD-fused uncharacterized protein
MSKQSAKKITVKIIPFLNGPFSQWHKKKFTVNEIEYNCCEQYMMAGKARLFKDDESLQKILNSVEPREQKKLGRKVKNFNENAWKKDRYDIVLTCNMAKFSQNDKLLKKLLDTNDAILCEANPKDKIWGIGLKATDPKVNDPKSWKGTNLLGEVLMEVRDELSKL